MKKQNKTQQEHWGKALKSYYHLLGKGAKRERLGSADPRWEEEPCGAGTQSSEKGHRPASAGAGTSGAASPISEEEHGQTSLAPLSGRVKLVLGVLKKPGN